MDVPKPQPYDSAHGGGDFGHKSAGGSPWKPCETGTVSLVPVMRRFTLRDGIGLNAVQWSDPTRQSGVPMILVHGLASNSRLWDGAARALVDLGHPVLAVDLRSHGRSDKTDVGLDVPSVAHDVADVLETLAGEHPGWARPVVAGQSWGGNIVVQLAASHGELTRGVVAVDGGTITLSKAFPDWEECERTLAPPRLVGMEASRLRGYIRAGHPDWTEEAIDGTMANMEIREDGTIAPWLTFERHIVVLHGLWSHEPSSLWRHISVPVLFTPASKNQDHMRATKAAQIEEAMRILPTSQVEWFEPADHDLHAQYPHRFAQLVHDRTQDGFFS